MFTLVMICAVAGGLIGAFSFAAILMLIDDPSAIDQHPMVRWRIPGLIIGIALMVIPVQLF